jgi:hypothetical protein
MNRARWDERGRGQRGDGLPGVALAKEGSRNFLEEKL